MGNYLILTFILGLALDFQVHGGKAELVALLSCQLLGGMVFQGVPHAEAPAHCGHLSVELLACDLVVKAQPAELDLHTKKKNYITLWSCVKTMFFRILFTLWRGSLKNLPCIDKLNLKDYCRTCRH